MRNASNVPRSHPRPSSIMARKAVSWPLKEALMNHLHLPNHPLALTSADSWGFPYEVQTKDALHVQGMPTASKTWTWMEDQIEEMPSIKPTHWGYPHPIDMDLDGGSDICWTDAYISSQSSCISLRLQSCENVSLADWPFHVAYDGAVTVIQEFNANLCTPLLVPNTPALLASSSVRATTQVTWNCWTLHQ